MEAEDRVMSNAAIHNACASGRRSCKSKSEADKYLAVCKGIAKEQDEISFELVVKAGIRQSAPCKG